MRGRGAFVALALLLVISLGGCDAPEPPVSPIDRADPPPAAPSPASLHAPLPEGWRFVDITVAAGIDFQHRTGGSGEKLLPETMGSGGAFLDFDGDGHLDIFLVNSGAWPDRPLPDQLLPDQPLPGDAPRCALYRGHGDGTFTDVSEESGAGIALYGMGCTVADPDADGDPDIYVTALGANVLLRNEGGTFTDATAEWGLAGGTWSLPGAAPGDPAAARPDWSTAAVWFDADDDGDLDLLVANYVAWDRTLEVFTTLDGRSKAFTTPDRYRGLPARLFVQKGNRAAGAPRFEEVGAVAGISRVLGKSLGIALWDLDDDGGLDVVIANDTRPNALFLHRGGGRFEERGLEAGIAYDESGRARAGMGIDVGVVGSGAVLAPTVAIGNFSDEPMTFSRRQPHGGFEPVGVAAELTVPTRAPLAFAVRFADLDLDGILDLVIVNGHIEPEVDRFFPGRRYAQPMQLFRGDAAGRFSEVGDRVGEDFARPRVGRGLALGDIDGDGDLDLLVTTNGGAPALLRNDLPATETAPRHFVRLRLRGRAPNLDALGARITLQAGGRTQVRTVRTGSSYLSESEPVVTFGLGAATTVPSCEIRWPSGVVEEVAIEAIDRTIELREPTGGE